MVQVKIVAVLLACLLVLGVLQANAQLTMKINGTTILDIDLTNADKEGDFSLFTKGAPQNISIMGNYCAFQIENMSVANIGSSSDITDTGDAKEAVCRAASPPPGPRCRATGSAPYVFSA